MVFRMVKKDDFELVKQTLQGLYQIRFFRHGGPEVAPFRLSRESVSTSWPLGESTWQSHRSAMAAMVVDGHLFTLW